MKQLGRASRKTSACVISLVMDGRDAQQKLIRIPNMPCFWLSMLIVCFDAHFKNPIGFWEQELISYFLVIDGRDTQQKLMPSHRALLNCQIFVGWSLVFKWILGAKVASNLAWLN